MPWVPFRVRSSREASPDLQRPVFDSTTLPVVLHPVWQYNYGEADLSMSLCTAVLHTFFATASVLTPRPTTLRLCPQATR